jgi:hypothetical protein
LVVLRLTHSVSNICGLSPALRVKDRWDRSRNLVNGQVSIVRMFVRPDFDNALVEQSRAHPSFTVLDNEAVRKVVYRGRFFLETNQRSLEPTS